MPKDIYLCILCGADTRVAGYTYGACNTCVKKLIEKEEQHKKAGVRECRHVAPCNWHASGGEGATCRWACCDKEE